MRINMYAKDESKTTTAGTWLMHGVGVFIKPFAIKRNNGFVMPARAMQFLYTNHCFNTRVTT